MLRSIEDANAVFERARIRADRDGAACVDSLYLLWAALRSVPAARLLRVVGVEPHEVNPEIERRIADLPRGQVGCRAELPGVLVMIGDRAVQEARELGHTSLDGRHVLLSLFAEQAGDARDVLAGHCWLEAQQLREGMRGHDSGHVAAAA